MKRSNLQVKRTTGGLAWLTAALLSVAGCSDETAVSGSVLTAADSAAAADAQPGADAAGADAGEDTSASTDSIDPPDGVAPSDAGDPDVAVTPDVDPPLDAAVDPDGAVVPDAVEPSDTVVGPDGVVEPDGVIAPDSIVGPDTVVVADTVVTPDAAQDTATPDVPPADTGLPGCLQAADCPKPQSVCLVATCTAGVCGAQPLADGTACDDGNACTSGDACSLGACKSAKPLTCDDGKLCTADGCDPKTGCTAVATTGPCVADAATCAQGQCNSAGACVAAAKAGCDDGNPCTQDTCSAGKCTNTASATGTVCATSPCAQDSTCNAGLCVAGKPKSCEDGNPCTTDSCLPGQGCAWAPSTAGCDDGNPCTAGEFCGVVAGKGVTCQGGKPVDAAVACDDKNPCTADSCDAVKGCLHPPKAGAPCDDGSACTTGETCQASGACQTANGAACDDGNPCTKDTCDNATKLCTFVANDGAACNDGQNCTGPDTCANGKCSGKALVCNDNNPCTNDVCDAAAGKCVSLANTNGLACDDATACTSNDACLAGKCTGAAVDCGDGNACTDDLCDPKTGKCNFLANTATCVGAVACLGGGKCKDGKCQAGTVSTCDDSSPCTTDTCDSATGKCVFTKVADGTVCDDGVACSQVSNCQAGACAPTAPCTVLALDSFDCAKPSAWKFDPPLSVEANADVQWAIDVAPTVDGFAVPGNCTLNYNDGENYCAKSGNGCIGQHGKATSPTLDFTKTAGLTPVVTMDTYYDVDYQTTANPPKVLVIDAASGALLDTVALPLTANDVKKIKPSFQLTLPKAQGKVVKLQLVLGAPTGDGGIIYDGGNQGKGWYVDNLKVEAAWKPEICGDGIDNNANGKADCADLACTGQASCTETLCGDGQDNDKDGSTDCKDSDCAKAANCTETACTDGLDNDQDGAADCGDKDCAAVLQCSALAKVLAADAILCASGGAPGSAANWTLSSSSSSVLWAFDQTPDVVGSCTLNFNNGKDYVPGSNGTVAGTAQWAKAVETTGLQSAAVQFKLWLDVENTDNSGPYDNLYVQVSSDEFKGCCAANQSCGQNSTCNSANTAVYTVPRLPLKTWRTVSYDIPKALVGKSLKVRLKFDSVDGQFNNFAGPFVSAFQVIGL